VIDDATRQVVFFALTGEAPMDEFRINLDQGIAGWVARTGKGSSAMMSRRSAVFQRCRCTLWFSYALCALRAIARAHRMVGIVKRSTPQILPALQKTISAVAGFWQYRATAIVQAKAFAAFAMRVWRCKKRFKIVYRLIAGSSPSMEDAIRLARTAQHGQRQYIIRRKRHGKRSRRPSDSPMESAPP